MTTRFVLATANPAKAVEIERILVDAGAPVVLVARPPDVPDVDEHALTFEDNARLKALALIEATGMPAIADDSGLEVDALGGAPGVHSARYAGPGASDADNCALLLERLGEVRSEGRRARFVAVAIARWPDGLEVAAFGSVEGAIATAPRGTGGFGYDPLFVADEAGGRTFAELDPAEKHAISHRGRAFRTLAEGLSVLAEVGDC